MARVCPACGTSFPDNVSFCGKCGTITIQEQDPSDPDARLGTQLGEYLLVARIADGAMGRVYEARHHSTRERCACKVLHSDVARDKVAVERFKREYEAAHEMDHEGIVSVIDFGTTDDGVSFLTMEYLQGEELGDLLRRDKTIPMDRLVRIICQAGAALDYAHSFGFIHRDLKPDNIFLCHGDDGDTVRILDFGSVKLQMETGPKLTAFGTTLGSPYYMSPEQAMGKPDVDQRSDVFALAAIIYEALTGTIAFEAPNVAQILMKIINQSPPAVSQVVPGLPASIEDVIDKGIAKDKAKRYGRSVELADGLCAALGLPGDHSAWTHKTAAEIGAALQAATPPAAKALGAASTPPAAGAAGGAPATSPGADGGSLPPAVVTSNNGLMIALAVAAVAVVVVAAVLLR